MLKGRLYDHRDLTRKILIHYSKEQVGNYTIYDPLMILLPHTATCRADVHDDAPV